MGRKKTPSAFSFIREVILNKKLLFSILSSVIFLITPFLNWFSSKLSYDGVSEEGCLNLFRLSGKPLNIKVFTFFGVCFILAGLLFIALEVVDYIINLRDNKAWIKYIEYVIFLLIIIMTAVIVNNETVTEYISYKDGEIEALKYWIEDVKGYCNRGVGPIFAVLGVLLGLVSRFGEMLYYLIANISDRLHR